MNYRLVDGLKEAHPVSLLCSVLDVHKSSYYYWQGHRQPTAQRVHLQVQAKAVHADTRQTYGSRRMSTALKAQGLDVGRYRARRLMQEAGLVAVHPKKRHVTPTGEVSRVADNHLNREFNAVRPNQKWVGDITYLWTSEGWVYLAVVLDLFSRRVVGWQLSASPDRHHADIGSAQSGGDFAAAYTPPWLAVSLRPRLPIYPSCLPGSASRTEYPSQYEPTRKLLG